MGSVNVKDLLAYIGPIVSLSGMIVTAFVGAMWVGRLDERVINLEKTSVSGERIATLEGEVKNLSKTGDELKLSINNLVLLLQRREDRIRDRDTQR